MLLISADNYVTARCSRPCRELLKCSSACYPGFYLTVSVQNCRPSWSGRIPTVGMELKVSDCYCSSVNAKRIESQPHLNVLGSLYSSPFQVWFPVLHSLWGCLVSAPPAGWPWHSQARSASCHLTMTLLLLACLNGGDVIFSDPIKIVMGLWNSVFLPWRAQSLFILCVFLCPYTLLVECRCFTSSVSCLAVNSWWVLSKCSILCTYSRTLLIIATARQYFPYLLIEKLHRIGLGVSKKWRYRQPLALLPWLLS